MGKKADARKAAKKAKVMAKQNARRKRRFYEVTLKKGVEAQTNLIAARVIEYSKRAACLQVAEEYKLPPASLMAERLKNQDLNIGIFDRMVKES